MCNAGSTGPVGPTGVWYFDTFGSKFKKFKNDKKYWEAKIPEDEYHSKKIEPAIIDINQFPQDKIAVISLVKHDTPITVKELRQWAEKNKCKIVSYHYLTFRKVLFQFKKPHMALLFKLTWG